MRFELSQRQKEARERARQFAQEALYPGGRNYSGEEEEIAEELVLRMGRAGILGLPAPEKYGGGGGDGVSLALSLMELAQASPSVGVLISVNSLVIETLALFGTETQCSRNIPPMTRGVGIGSFATTEEEAGSDVAAIRTEALRRGRGYVLRGKKRFITNGARPGPLVLSAVTERRLGRRGISLFILDKGRPGVRVARLEEKMGLKASDTADLLFEDCTLTKEDLLGVEGEGLKMLLAALDRGRVCVAAHAVGVGRACLRASIRALEEAGDSQGRRFMLADSATEIEAAELLTLRAAFLKDGGLPFTREASMAKLFATEAALRAAHRAVELEGLDGIRRGGAERLLRDVRPATIYEGTSEVQRLVIARGLLGLKGN